MNSNSLVSVIVPIFNEENYIADTLESIQNQSYSNWELLLIDDGSTDSSRAVVEKYLDDERIRYFYQENQGQGSTRNFGIKKSKGTYLAFLDADDFWNPGKLKIQLRVLSEKSIDLVYSKLRLIDSRNTYLNKDLGNGIGVYKGFRAIFLLAAGSMTIPNSSVIVTKESVIQAGCFDEDESVRNIEDYDLWFRIIFSGGKIYGLKESLGAYRIHRGQSTYSERGSSLNI